METKLIYTKNYLLLIDEEAEIKENTNTFKEGFNGDWFWNSKYNSIQRIGDITEFDFKIIAYYPLTKEAKELDLPLLPNPFEDPLKTLIDSFNQNYNRRGEYYLGLVDGAKLGYKAAQSKQFSLDDIESSITQSYFGMKITVHNKYSNTENGLENLKSDIIQSLSTQRLPKEFVVSRVWENVKGEKGKRFADVALQDENGEFDAWLVNETTTNSEGKEELIGTYKY